MRKLLLNPTPLFRKLRQLSMLLTLLLALPQTAWGQDKGYGITIGGTPITSDNKDNVLGESITKGTVTFDSETNTLTLNGATITGLIHWTNNTDLTIELIGANSITRDGFCIDYVGSGSGTATPRISFTAGGTAGSECSLELSTGTVTNESVISGFSTSMGPGLFWIPTWTNDVVTSATITNSILGGGSGTTTTDPFIIKTADDFKNFAQYVNNKIIESDVCVKLSDEISENGLDCSSLAGFQPIGIEGNEPINFKGTFDGNKKTIKNLSITGVEDVNVGLFRCLDGGTITQLTLDGCTIIGGNSSSVIGGIVGYVSNNGTVSECIVQNNSSISSNTSSQNPTVGGIVGYLDSGTITNCFFQNSHVNAESSLDGAVSGPNANAGGIVGKASGTVSNCQVKGTAEISAIYSIAEKENTKAGAIIGDNMGATLSENAYDYSVKTKVRNSTSTELTTYSGYTQRGIGGMLYNSTTQQNEPYPDITENNGAVMYTKIVSLPTENSAGTVAGVDGTYYKVEGEGTSLYVAPGQTATIDATPNTANNFALAWLQAVKTGTTDVVICDSNNIANGGRRYTFTMPDAGVTVNVSWDELYNLWIGDAQVTSNNAAHILGENNTTVSFTAADPQQATSANTLTLNGATLEVPVKVGLANLTFDIQGTNSITTNTTCIQIYNTTSTIPTLTFKSTSDEVGNLTLKNTDNSNTGVISSGFSGNFTISNELTLLTSGNHTLSDGEVHEAQLVPFYGVQVGETLVHSGNATDVLGDGTISFNKNDSTLTLNNANAGGISTSLTELKIELVGNNTLTETTGQPVLRSLNDSKVTIKIQSTAETKGMLKMKTSNGNFYDRNVTLSIIPPLGVISGKLYGNNQNENTVIIGEAYNLSVAGTAVTILNKDNVLGDGKISFTPSSNTLTLNGATITGPIEYSNSTLLTIALNGTSSIGAPNNTYVINISNANGSLSFVKADGASNAELTLKSGDGATMTISAPDSILGSGLYWKNIAVNHLVITEDPNFVIINDYVMTDTRTINGTTAGTITYNSTDKVLTLNGFQNNFGAKHAIKTGVKDLKVKLTGESTINCAADSTVFYAFSNSASIQFVKVDATSKLNMVGTAIDKFADGSVTYDGLVLYSDNYIAIPEPPTMALNSNDKVELTITYSGGTIATKYSIDYADETADVTNATYSDPFEMAAPGTVTAWVEANGATTSTVKGKHFGYQDAPFVMAANETKTPVLIPAFEAGDNIEIAASDPYTSSDTGVATFANGVITAIGIGKANLSTTLANTNDREHTVILNKDNMFTIEVNVGAIMEGVTFAPNMLYATYCNTTNKNMTVPEGMTAYAVTGTEGNNVTTEVVEFLPMNVPLLLMRSDASTEVGMSLEYDGTATAPATNILNFTNSDLATTGKEYVLYNDEFVKATSTIPQKHCYLLITNPAPTRGYYSIGHGNDGSTAIDDTLIDNEETTNDDWYDLQGRRIQKPTKAGIYIVNGKKMIVK